MKQHPTISNNQWSNLQEAISNNKFLVRLLNSSALWVFHLLLQTPRNPPVPSRPSTTYFWVGQVHSNPPNEGNWTKLKPLKNHLLRQYRDTSIILFGIAREVSAIIFFQIKIKLAILEMPFLYLITWLVWRGSRTWITVIWDLIGLPHQRRASVDDHRILNGIMGHVTVDVPRPTDQETHQKKHSDSRRKWACVNFKVRHYRSYLIISCQLQRTLESLQPEFTILPIYQP